MHVANIYPDYEIMALIYTFINLSRGIYYGWGKDWEYMCLSREDGRASRYQIFLREEQVKIFESLAQPESLHPVFICDWYFIYV